jgi:hypothetical protein
LQRQAGKPDLLGVETRDILSHISEVTCLAFLSGGEMLARRVR